MKSPTCNLKAPLPESFSWIPSTMAPAIRLALALLLVPALILSEPLHVPLSRRRRTHSMNWVHEANRMRLKYGYSIPTSQSHRSNRRATADNIPIFDEVHIFIYLFCFKSTHHKNRVLIIAILLFWRLAHRKLHIFIEPLLYPLSISSIPVLNDLTGPRSLRSVLTPDLPIYGYSVKIVLVLALLEPPLSTHQIHPHSKK